MTTFHRILPRTLMVVAGAGALAAVAGAFAVLGYQTPDTWTVLAASFAVITSIISAWTAMSVLEFERDKRRPDVSCYIDFTSRQGLVLFRIENHGGSNAYDSELIWDDPMTNNDGNPIGFGNDGDRTKVAILRPGQSLAKVIDSAHHTVNRHSGKVYQGHVTYRDAAGGRHRNDFTICVEDFFGTPVDDNEFRNAAVKLQRVPERLEHIGQKLDQISNTISQFKKQRQF